MAEYQFLSDEWIGEAKKIRAEYEGQETGARPVEVKANLVITEVPFKEDGNVEAHLDTTGNGVEVDLGHIDDSQLKITLDYGTAKAILIEGNAQAGMQAFMAGKIKVEGDMAKLMALQAAPPDSTTEEITKRLQEITA
jgi:putative sterol carrier protein